MPIALGGPIEENELARRGCLYLLIIQSAQ